MTDIQMRMLRQSSEGRARLEGASFWVPTKAVGIKTGRKGLLLPVPLTIHHRGSGDALIEGVEPCHREDGWCWIVTTWVDGVITDVRAVLVPNSNETVLFDELETVDPQTLDPANINQDAWDTLRDSVIAARDGALAAVAQFPDGAERISGTNLMSFTRNGAHVLDPVELVPGPQGLPGTNAIPADEAVAGYISGESNTSDAGDQRWVSKKLVPASVKDYGAMGNGVTDDTGAFATALAANATVTVPSGTFILSDLAIPEGKTLQGTPGAILKVVDNASSEGLVTLDGGTLTGFEVDGNGAAQGDIRQTVITLTGEGAKLSNLTVRHAYDVAVRVSEDASHFAINGVILRDNGMRDNCNGFYIQGSYGTVSNCQVYRHGNGHGFITSTGGTQQQGPVEHIVISNCLVRESEHNAYTFERGSRNIVLSSSSASFVPQPVKGNNCEDITVSNCTFSDIELAVSFDFTNVSSAVIDGVIMKRAGGGFKVGPGSSVTNCVLEDIGLDKTSGVFGVFSPVEEGTVRVSGNHFKNIRGRTVALGTGGIVTNNYFEEIENLDSGYHVIIGTSSSSPPSGSVLSGNVLKNASGDGTRSMNAFSVSGTDWIATNNVLIGSATRGLYAWSNSDRYAVVGNIVSSADTPVFDRGEGSVKLVKDNV